MRSLLVIFIFNDFLTIITSIWFKRSLTEKSYLYRLQSVLSNNRQRYIQKHLFLSHNKSLGHSNTEQCCQPLCCHSTPDQCVAAGVDVHRLLLRRKISGPKTIWLTKNILKNVTFKFFRDFFQVHASHRALVPRES